jgi:hypothetical protein
MIAIVTAMLREPVKPAYWCVVAIVAAAAATGLKPVFVPEMGWFLGGLAAFVLAVIIEVLFAESLCQWRCGRGPLYLCLAALFCILSMICDTPYLFRMMNGAQLTMRQFAEQRDAAVRDVVVARERLAAAAEAAHDLAAVSRQKAEREAAAGDSCERSSRGRGARYEFRVADVEGFQQIEQAVAGRSKRLDAEAAHIQALPAETGEALQQGLGKLNASLAAAFSIVHDPALAAAADQLDGRAGADEAVRHGRDGEAFRCPDAMIRDRARATAGQLRSLPDLQQRVAVADFTDANTVMIGLPARIAASIGGGFGKPGGLTSTDLIALAVSTALELLLIGATFHVPVRRAIGRRLHAAQDALDETPVADLSTFLNLLGEADPELCRLWSLLNRYRLRLWLWEVVVVAHGVDDPHLVQFSRVMSILAAIGWARRYRTLPLPFVRLVAWWRWREIRRAPYLEYFRVDRRALDELNLGELLARIRAERALAEDAPRRRAAAPRERPAALQVAAE